VPLASVRYKRPLEVAAMARAMGLMAWVVDSPNQIQQAVKEALLHSGPSLIEVRVDGNIAPPLGDRAKSIAGFVEP
jgi:acetolactate synthase-1/2/3 large subunit